MDGGLNFCKAFLQVYLIIFRSIVTFSDFTEIEASPDLLVKKWKIVLKSYHKTIETSNRDSFLLIFVKLAQKLKSSKRLGPGCLFE